MKAMSTAASTVRHAFAATSEAIVLVAILAALVVGAAILTGRAPIGAGSALGAQVKTTIVVSDGTFGGMTTATVVGSGGANLASTAGTSMWVHATCIVEANGSLGLVAWERTDSSGRAVIALGPTASWLAGSASCRADAGSFDKFGRFRVSATTTFNVSS